MSSDVDTTRGDLDELNPFNQLEWLRFCHSCEVNAVNLLKQREHIPDMGIGSSLCVTMRLWGRQWQVVLQKVSKFCELLSAGYKTIWWTIAKIDSMTRAVLAELISTVNLRKYQWSRMSLVTMWHARDEQTFVVRGAPDAGSSCLQPVYHTLSKIVNSHIMDENCLLNSTANENSELWILVFWMEHSQAVALYTSWVIFKLNTRRTTDRILKLKYDSYVRVLLEQKSRQAHPSNDHLISSNAK